MTNCAFSSNFRISSRFVSNDICTKNISRFFAIKSPNLSKSIKDRLKVIAGNKWTLNGEIVITAEKHRSQSKNRELAKSKLVGLILKALEKPVYRLQTRPSKSVRIRRSNEKQKRSKIKALRGRVRDGQI